VVIGLTKGDKSKNVGIVRINLADFMIDSSEKTLQLDKCPDKDAALTFSFKATLISENASSDALSMMSDVMSIDSGPESDYDFDDLEDDGKGTDKAKRSVRRPPA
jgi:hypothetical protein